MMLWFVLVYLTIGMLMTAGFVLATMRIWIDFLDETEWIGCIIGSVCFYLAAFSWIVWVPAIVSHFQKKYNHQRI